MAKVWLLAYYLLRLVRFLKPFCLVLGHNSAAPFVIYTLNWWMQIVQKTFIKEGGQSMAPNQVAGEILSFFTRNNFTVSDRGEVIT